MRPKKIAILLPYLRGGGAERLSLDLAREFAAEGHSIDIVVKRARGELAGEARAAFRVLELGADRTRHVPLRLAAYLRRERPDAAIANLWPLTAAAPLARAISRHHCRLAVVEHHVLSLKYRDHGPIHNSALHLSTAAAYRMADARIGVSRGVADDMARISGMVAGRVAVIHNPIPRRCDPSATEREMAETLWATPRGIPRILAVGRLTAAKNHALLLRAFSLFAAQRDARLMLVGNGEMEGKLRDLSDQLAISGKVIFAGFQPNPLPFYATADVFALSSDMEGFGNVIVESLSAGLPVVATDCPSGPAEILDNGRFGRLVPTGDANSLAEAIVAALEDRHDRPALRRRAADFLPAIAARRYLELLTGTRDE